MSEGSSQGPNACDALQIGRLRKAASLGQLLVSKKLGVRSRTYGSCRL